jgi:outer membrane protein
MVYKQVKPAKNGYVEIDRLVNEFAMTKEYKGKLEVVTNARKHFLDSLGLELKSMNAGMIAAGKSPAEDERFQQLKTVYIENSKDFEQQNQALAGSYNQKIFAQINQYVKDYGKENNYEYVFGAEGSGVLMYAKQEDNLTDKLIEYANQKYKGISPMR